MIKVNKDNLCENCFSKTGKEPCPVCGFSKKEYLRGNGILPIGSTLADRYLIGQMIGQGGFGITYRAYDMNNEKVVAVKEYYPNSMAVRNTNGITVRSSPDDIETVFKKGLERFYEEAQLVSRFNGNPNIVSVYDCFYANDTAYQVMEFLEGITLKEYVKKNGALSAEEALFVLSEMSNALMIAHSAKVLHRDISPDNIMLCDNGGLKLIDFGAARQVMADNPKSMSVILKSGFAPIEQYQKRSNQGPWTDIYSLGATIYYLLTTEGIDDPVTRLEDEGILKNDKGIEPQLWNIIDHCLKLKAADRYQSAFELKDAIEKISYKPLPIKGQKEEVSVNEAQVNATRMIFGQEAEGTKYLFKKPSDDLTEIIDENTKLEESAPDNADNTGNSEKVKSKKPFMIGGAVATALVIGIVAVAVTSGNSADDISISVTEDTSVTVGTTVPETEATTKKTTTTKKKSTTKKETTAKSKETTARKSETTTEATTVTETAAVETTVTTTAVSTTAATTTTPKREMITIGKVSFYTDATDLDLSSGVTGKKLNNSDLDFLKKMTNLNWIQLHDNNLTDLSVLSDITTLQGVKFTNNNVKDISFAKNLTNLTYIDGIDNGITDISALANHTKLTEVWLGGNNIKDISPLKDCVNIEYLHLNLSPIKNIDVVANMKKLRYIAVQNCGLTDISPLKGHTSLEEVYIGNDDESHALNQIKSLSPLKDCTKVKILVVNRSPIGNIDAVANMKDLVTIDVTNCGLIDISPLNNHTALEKVCIGNTIDDATKNQIKSLSPLKNCTKIKYLYVNWSPIGSIDAVTNMKELEEINLVSCELTDISALKNCRKLRVVTINYNSINDVSALRNANGLEFLGISGNSVSEKDREKFLGSFKGIHFVNNAELYFHYADGDEDYFCFYSKVEAEELKDSLICDGKLNFYYKSEK